MVTKRVANDQVLIIYALNVQLMLEADRSRDLRSSSSCHSDIYAVVGPVNLYLFNKALMLLPSSKFM